MKALIYNIQKFSLHDGKGIRTTIFFKGCSLNCEWCANPESLSAQPELIDDKIIGRQYSLEEIMTEILKDKPFYDKSGGGVTLSGGEPLLQAEFICALCDALHDAVITVGIETNANVPPNVFREVLKRCVFAFIDLKHWDNTMHLKGTGADYSQILKNLTYALTQAIPVIVRIPIIPNYNMSEADAHAFASLLAKIGAKEVQLLPFHQLGENKYAKQNKSYAYAGVKQLHDEDLAGFAEVLASAGFEVQIGG